MWSKICGLSWWYSREHKNITTARDSTLALITGAGAVFGNAFSKSYWTNWQRIEDSYGVYPYTMCYDRNLTYHLSLAGIPCPDISMEEFYEYAVMVCWPISSLTFIAVHLDLAYNLAAAIAFIAAGVMLIVSTLQIEILYDYIAPGLTQKENFMWGWKIAAGILAFLVSSFYALTSYYLLKKGGAVPNSSESQ